MPVLAVFATAPNMGHGKYTAMLEPCNVLGIEKRIECDAVRTVAFEKSGIRSIEFGAFAIDDGERNECPIVALGFYFHGLEIGGLVEFSNRLQTGVGQVLASCVKGIDLARFRPGGQLQQRARNSLIGCGQTDATLERQLNRTGLAAGV